MKRLLLLSILAGCGQRIPPVRLTEDCAPQPVGDYEDVTETWTRYDAARGEYQEAVNLHATFKSPDWRVAKAVRDAGLRRLEGEQRNAAIAQACADMAGPYEVELMLTTWDRRENDLDRGERSVWRVKFIDDHGNEIAPKEIVKDRRPARTVRADYPMFGEFATAYVARFERPAQDKPPLLGPSVRTLRLVMSGPRGSVELKWP